LFTEPEATARVVFSDLPKDEAERWAIRMPIHSRLSFGGKLTYPAYECIPVTYIHTETDLLVDPKSQHKVVARIEKGSGRRVQTFSLESGHCPNVGVPEELANLIDRAIAPERR
jgi:pimeloyl-ACP methyl ester carboxylesterase